MKRRVIKFYKYIIYGWLPVFGILLFIGYLVPNSLMFIVIGFFIMNVILGVIGVIICFIRGVSDNLIFYSLFLLLNPILLSLIVISNLH